MQPTPINSSAGINAPKRQTNSSTSSSCASLGPHKVSILGLDKASVLMALFNNAKFHLNRPVRTIALENMSIESAREVIKKTLVFEYVYDRIIKTDISGDVVDTWRYDRDNGDNAGFTAIESLRK